VAPADPIKGKSDADVQDILFLADSRPVLIRLHLRLDGKPYLAAWNAFMDELFASLDKNKDGVLDREEAARAPAPQAIFSSGGFYVGVRNFGGPASAGPAANRDGKVTRAEFADYYRKNGGAPFQLVGGSNQPDGYRIARRARMWGTQDGSGSADALSKALMDLLDTDKDGKLSRQELAAAPERLLKKDADDDEMVTAAELLGQAPTGQLGYRVVVDGAAAPPLAADSPFVALTPGESPRALAKRLLARYAPPGSKDGRLSRKQLGLDEATFKLLDADEDGQLDAEELGRFARRPPDVELTVNLGKDGGVVITEVKGRPLPVGIKVKAGKAPAVGVPRLAPPVRLKVKGFQTAPPAVLAPGGGPARDMVTLEVGNTVVELRLASGGFGGGMVFFPDGEQFYKMQFSAADQDNNGYLDMNEARRSVFGPLFKQMDADGDGKLYLKEVLAFVNKMKTLKDKASACCLSLSVSDQGRGLFDLLDTNGDGRLSVREMRNAVKLLERLDRNGDGKIDRSEIPRRYAVEARRGPSGGGGGQAGFVVAYGGAPMIGPAPPRQAGPLWFRKMDRNGDGDVSRKEWLGSEELFKKIDTDGDGLISAEEATKADALMRKKK
jgi:Ca2+-binding EF-hand superfamily protein